MKFRLFFLFIFALLISCSDDDDKDIVQPPQYSFKWLSVSGTNIIDEDGNPMALHGVNRSGFEYDIFGNRINADEIKYICDNWKANIIRLPFNEEWILTNTAYNNFLDQIIGWIKENGAYVLLDLQWQDTQTRIPSIPDTAAIRMWKILAKRYKDDPAVLYDIHNEAHDVSFSAWRSRAGEIIDGIQSVHPKALCFVSAMNWATDLRDWNTDPLTQANVVYSVHAYSRWGGKAVWDENWGQFANDLPIFIGELGGEVADLEWGRQLLAYLNGKGLGWCAWSWVDSPFLTNPNDRRTPSDFGELVKGMLLRHADPQNYANKISGIKVEFITQDRATINWKTSNESDSKVLYGLTADYDKTFFATAPLKAHTAKLSSLSAATTYHFKIVSVDVFGFVAESSDSTFATAAQ